MIIVLGIESSCDETAVGIIHEDDEDYVEILSNTIYSQQKEHEEYGGVVPELAARRHLKNIKPAIEQALEESSLKIHQVDVIASTYGPGLIGGLLIGNLFAKTIASTLKKPFIAINHLEAHVLMPLMNNQNISYPFLAVLVSGGHTQIILAEDFGEYKILGETIDDSIGEAFDKVALDLGMSYPGGPQIEKSALKGNPQAFKFPMPLCTGEYTNDTNFSLSGLKTHVKLLVRTYRSNNNLNSKVIADICATFQYTILQILFNRIQNAIKKSNLEIEDIVVSGGVSANQYLRDGLIKTFPDLSLHFADIKLSTDNGVMIAWTGLLKYKYGLIDSLDSKIVPKILW